MGICWWFMARVSALDAIAGRFVQDDDGHEIWLEGEEKGRKG